MVARILRGCRRLPCCGPHPGTPWLLMFVGLGAMVAGWTGALVSALFFGPLYLWGAYERAKLDEETGL